MSELHPRRGPLRTIKGWMIGIAVIGVVLGTLVVDPFVFVGALVVLMEGVAIARFLELRRRGPMPALTRVAWAFAFVAVIPILSLVAGLATLYIYCSINPNAYNGMPL